MSKMNPTCFFTGKKDNLLMYAHLNRSIYYDLYNMKQQG
jgi:hypothetical protein